MDFLTMRLVVVLTAAAALITLSTLYLNSFMAWFGEDRARQEANRVAELAREEYALGAPGSGSTLSVTFPGSIKRIVYGSAPGGDVAPASNVYFIEFRDGSVETYVADCRFAYGNRSTGAAYDAPVTLYPGEYTLDIKVEKVNDTYYAVIYGGTMC